MTNKTSGYSCTQMCWALAVAIGLAALLIFWLVLDFGAIGSIFFAALVFMIAGFLLTWICCSDLKTPAPGTYNVGNTARATDDAASPRAAAAASAPEAPAEADVADAAVAEPAVEEPEVAERVAEAAPAPAAASAPASTQLAGEEELSARKGSWKYEGGSEPAAAPAAPAPSGEDYDKDGVIEGTDEGEKPATMDAPRDGKADDLKQIKGVGPKLEKMLNGMGFWHFDQVAGWTDQEVAWVDANLEGFKGRVSRDEWVAQARVLAAGGETEFSKRVEEGDVY